MVFDYIASLHMKRSSPNETAHTNQLLDFRFFEVNLDLLKVVQPLVCDTIGANVVIVSQELKTVLLTEL